VKAGDKCISTDPRATRRWDITPGHTPRSKGEEVDLGGMSGELSGHRATRRSPRRSVGCARAKYSVCFFLSVFFGHLVCGNCVGVEFGHCVPHADYLLLAYRCMYSVVVTKYTCTGVGDCHDKIAIALTVLK